VDLSDTFATARTVGEDALTEFEERIRASLIANLRRSVGIEEEPPPPCDDPELAYVDPRSVVRIVHSDLAVMLIGGLSSLLLQSLHPSAMAGVAQHSRYREDPLGRLERTAKFVGTTSFRSKQEASDAIARVRRIHARVTGETPEHAPYRAQDPELLRWVHIAEVRSFLAAFDRFGSVNLSPAERDSYVADMAPVAIDLGASVVPTTTDSLDLAIDRFRPELHLTEEAKDVRTFVLRGVRRLPHEVAAYSLLVAAAVGILPPWARRQLRLPTLPLVDRLAVGPAASVFSAATRWVVPPMTKPTGDQVVSVRPPSTVTT
jgi:uncharacterized protein (DUF2236 family)